LPTKNNNGQIVYLQIPIKIQKATYYLAPNIVIRNYFGKNKYQSFSSFSCGVVSENNLVQNTSNNLKSTFYLGSSLSQGIDFSINKNVLIGIETKVVIGGFNDIIQATKSSDDMFEFPKVQISISRVEATIGLRLNSVFEN
jgi:ferredoxin-fold anticodon binding domain-containing protein